MIGIIKRDLILTFSDTKQRVFIFFMIPFLILAIDTQRMDWLYFMIVVSISYLLILIPFYYDINNKSDSMVASLPISRKEIVIYKYLGVFVYLFISIVYVGIYLWIINKIGLVDVDYFSLSMIKKAIPYIMLSMSIVFPINFTFGPRVVQIANMLIYLGMNMTVFRMAQKAIDGSPSQVINLLESPGFLIISLGIFILSMIFSIKLYENKDL